MPYLTMFLAYGGAVIDFPVTQYRRSSRSFISTRSNTRPLAIFITMSAPRRFHQTPRERARKITANIDAARHFSSMTIP